MLDPNSDIGDDEVLWRRVAKDAMAAGNRAVLDNAFRPTTRDTTGISVYRRIFHCREQVACELRLSGATECWVVGLSARMLRELGLNPTPAPSQKARGHSVIGGIRSANADSDDVTQAKSDLARMVGGRVGSSYRGPKQPDGGTWDKECPKSKSALSPPAGPEGSA